MKQYFVYILTNKTNSTLYIGVTNDLIRRVYEHKKNLLEDKNTFTTKYKVKKLVYYEIFQEIDSAIEREKQLKKWNRKWKEDLIEKLNPNWEDLYESIIN